MPTKNAEQPFENTIRAMVQWLEANQPDVFRRGLWDAINAANLGSRESAVCQKCGEMKSNHADEDRHHAFVEKDK